MSKVQKHYEESVLIPATLVEIFVYVDDHKQFPSHMSKSSWMMGGGKMGTSVDDGRGQKVGSYKVHGESRFLHFHFVKLKL